MTLSLYQLLSAPNVALHDITFSSYAKEPVNLKDKDVDKILHVYITAKSMIIYVMLIKKRLDYSNNSDQEKAKSEKLRSYSKESYCNMAAITTIRGNV